MDEDAIINSDNTAIQESDTVELFSYYGIPRSGITDEIISKLPKSMKALDSRTILTKGISGMKDVR